jgi:hypothetical protein
LDYRSEGPFSIAEACEVHRHLPPFSKIGAPSIEIHWSIVNPTNSFEVDVEELWRRARPAKIAEVEVLVLSPEDLFLHLCLHTSYQSQFTSGLRAFCDIIETLRSMNDEIAPEQVTILARQWKATRSTFFTLYLMRELLATTITDAIFEALESDVPDSELVACAREHIFFNHDTSSTISYNLVRFWKTQRFQDKAAAFLKFVFVSRKTMAAMYPVSPASKRIYYYYLVRIKDVFLRHGRTGWRLFYHDKKTTSIAEYKNREIELEQWLTSEG